MLFIELVILGYEHKDVIMLGLSNYIEKSSIFIYSYFIFIELIFDEVRWII